MFQKRTFEEGGLLVGTRGCVCVSVCEGLPQGSFMQKAACSSVFVLNHPAARQPDGAVVRTSEQVLHVMSDESNIKALLLAERG